MTPAQIPSYTLIQGLAYIYMIIQELDTYEAALTVFLYMAGLSSICIMRAILGQFTSKILTEMSFRLMTFVSLGPNYTSSTGEAQP